MVQKFPVAQVSVNNQDKLKPVEFDRFIRKPFTVQAVEITRENLRAVAKLVGEVQGKGSGMYIALDRRVVPNVTKAYPGWFLTKVNDNYRCFSPDIFREQFTEYFSAVTFYFEGMPEEATDEEGDDDYDDDETGEGGDETPAHGIPRPEDVVTEGA